MDGWGKRGKMMAQEEDEKQLGCALLLSSPPSHGSRISFVGANYPSRCCCCCCCCCSHRDVSFDFDKGKDTQTKSPFSSFFLFLFSCLFITIRIKTPMVLPLILTPPPPSTCHYHQTAHQFLTRRPISSLIASRHQNILFKNSFLFFPLC